jgi:hypothetical protein
MKNNENRGRQVFRQIANQLAQCLNATGRSSDYDDVPDCHKLLSGAAVFQRLPGELADKAARVYFTQFN